ncbi:hypothetical protein [Vannielia litorea]|uniref:Polyketide cyclase / dehydrase and lipid transport n=1 Tax=Vannielia litorea TaxID=1217970 RepID=A0A1N6FTM5_9RHOB|nr:hypothetical protein [Vannielia litorea]SIN98645.1 hypothetical protein SAMN05444002_1950 [Vannielia litorea]
MSDASPASLAAQGRGTAGLRSRVAARLIRLRHSRGRLFYAVFLAWLTGLALNGPLDVVLGLLFLLADGFDVSFHLIRPTVVCLAFTAVLGLLYAAFWMVTTLFALALRSLTEWLATLVLLGATLKNYAPGVIEAVPHWAVLLTSTCWLLHVVLLRTGLAFRPLPGLTRHRRARFTLPLPPMQAWERLRAHPDRRHWDAGWASITEVTPGDDRCLKVEIRRRGASSTLWLRYSAEVPGERFTLQAAPTPEALDARPQDGETLHLAPHGARGTLVEVRSREAHSLFTLCNDPMEDRTTDHWAHAAAQISGLPDGTMAASLMRPANR